MQEVSQVLEISIMYTYIKWACIDFGPLMFVFVKQKYSLCYTTTLYTAHFPILRTSVGWCTLYSTHRVYNVHTFSNNLNRMGKHATKTAAEKKIKSRSVPSSYTSWAFHTWLILTHTRHRQNLHQTGEEKKIQQIRYHCFSKFMFANSIFT